MKKMYLLVGLCCFLCACSGHYKLRVNNSSIVSAEALDKNLYYMDKTGKGHNFDLVKHESINESSSQIQIPVIYTEKTASIPTKIPTILQENLNKEIISFPVSCEGVCNITKNQLTVDLKYIKAYDENRCSGQEVMFVVWPLWPFTIPYYISECTGTLLNASSTMNLLNSASYLNEKKLGINVGVTIKPEQLFLNCEKKKCEVQDAQGNPVNTVYIHKELKVDQKRIDELLLAEKKEKELQAEKERKEKIAYRKWYKEADAVCPTLIQQVQHMQVNPYSYNIKVKKGIIYSYQKYDCARYASILASELYY